MQTIAHTPDSYPAPSSTGRKVLPFTEKTAARWAALQGWSRPFGRRVLLALVGIFVGLNTPALAQNRIQPAIVYDAGGKFDKSFNEAAFAGMQQFKATSGVNFIELEIAQEAQREQFLRRLAKRGADPIVAVGFASATAVQKVAAEFPKTRFTLIDAEVKLPNVQSILFKEQEGSFLVGMLGALASKSGKLGFIGGMDIPLIRAFSCGYAQGAKYGNPKVTLIENMAGSTNAAWNDPTRGAELAKGQFDRGVDVVFAAAGGTGLGVYRAAKDAGRFAIGVDSNQNHLQPGTMLTSMVKRVDVAVQRSLSAAQAGQWKGGLQVIGLAEDGIAWALDEHNRKLVSPQMKAKLDQARADILAGKIVVHDFRRNGRCSP
jgi:basic membrane protein A